MYLDTHDADTLTYLDTHADTLTYLDTHDADTLTYLDTHADTLTYLDTHADTLTYLIAHHIHAHVPRHNTCRYTHVPRHTCRYTHSRTARVPIVRSRCRPCRF